MAGIVQPSGTIERAQVILKDKTGGYFKEPDLWGWFNDAQREVALQVPESTAVTVSLTLIAGVAQSTPATLSCLLDIPRNVTGEEIRIIDRNLLDELRPGWAKEAGTSVIKHYIYERDASGRPIRPKNFEVWPPARVAASGPPAVAGAVIECIASAMPDDSSFETNEFIVDIAYANAILDYILYRALSELTGNQAYMARASAHLQAFMMGCGKDAENKLLGTGR